MRRSAGWIGGLALLAGIGCADTSLRGPGEVCVRSVQCAPGLGCINGMCSNDTSLLEGGTAVLMDAQMLVDAGDVDAAMIDSGGPVDAGPPFDAGPGMDAGPPRMDAGPPRMDAGPPMMDAGPPDAGPPDAGPPPDAG
ncbi:MAG: EB domain-containing protein [Sandaracinaceae bacterium]